MDGRAGNAGLFGAEQFARMRPRSLFLNLSRGFVLDHEALRDNILSGHIAGAAVDVFPHEPCTESPLFGLPNTVLTPHTGGSSAEALAAVGEVISTSTLAALRGEQPTTFELSRPVAVRFNPRPVRVQPVRAAPRWRAAA